MNCFLQLIQKHYSIAYANQLELEMNKKLLLVWVWALAQLVGNVIIFILCQSMVISYFTLSKFLLLLLLGVALWFIRRRLRGIQRALRIINLCFDIILVAFQFSFYPWHEKDFMYSTDNLGIFIIAWSSCLGCFSIYYAVTCWYLKAVIPLAQTIYLLSFLDKDQANIDLVIIFACECIVVYACYVYISERSKRNNFIERKQLEENTKAIVKILDDVTQGVMIVDEKHQTVYSNRHANVLFGQQVQTEAGKRLIECLSSRLRIKSVSPSWEVLETERIVTPLETEQKNLETPNEHLETIITKLFNLNSSELSVVVETDWLAPEQLAVPQNQKNFSMKLTKSYYMQKQVIVILTTETNHIDSLMWSKKTIAYRNSIISSLSHGLRTPLNVSINFIERALEDNSIPQSSKGDLLVPALRSSRLLLSFVNDILDYLQMQTGKLRFVFEARDVFETAKECVELFELQAKSKSLHLKICNNLQSASAMLVTDHTRLRQIIVNLLSNAVKFTFKGGITIILDPIVLSKEASPTGGPFRGVRVTCRDTGIGMNLQEQNKLSKALKNAELETLASLGPLQKGLGLLVSDNLVKRLTPEALIGKRPSGINFDSKELIGTTFTFEVYNNKINDGKPRQVNLETEEKYNMKTLSLDKGIELGDNEELSKGIRLPITSLHTHSRLSIRSPFSKRQTMATPQFLELYRTQTSTSSPISCRCPQALIVDDDPFTVSALEQTLSKLKISSNSVRNSEEAREKIRKRQQSHCSFACQEYKVVFIDVSTPMDDGYKTAALIKEMIKKKEIEELKIIGCTTFLQAKDEEKAKAAGMDRLLVKPIDLAEVRESLAELGLRGT